MSTKFNAAVEAAVANCLAYSARTHCEKAILLSRTGDVLIEKEGDARSVKFTNDESATMKGCLLIHNHPLSEAFGDTGTSLSGQDILLATRHHVEVWAVTEDGGRYKTHGFTSKGIACLDELDTLQNNVKARVGFVALFDSKTANSIVNHVTNQLFARYGFADYRFEASHNMNAKMHSIELYVHGIFEDTRCS